MGKLAEYAKAIVALIGAFVTWALTDFLPNAAHTIAGAFAAAATAGAVAWVKNRRAGINAVKDNVGL